MYKRHINHELKDLCCDYPVVTVIGPRQSGKTTLVREAFPNMAYVNLENPDVRVLAESDPRSFLTQHMGEGLILDEIQRVPSLLSYIQVIVDESHQKGQFILTGSHQLELHQAITQSLAGRTALLTLLPMSLAELNEAGISQSIDKSILLGGYPRIHSDSLNPTKAYRNYFQTYVERDVRQIINLRDITQFERFIRICAGRVGQVIKFEQIGNEVGISSHTVKHWISILEASFVVFRIQPYFENFGKRVIKSPKLYFTDTGLLSYLLGLQEVDQVARDPLRGHIFENLVVLELMKWRYNQGLDPALYFYRDAQGRELDLIYQKGSELVPIEIKSSHTFNPTFLKGLSFFKSLVGDRCQEGYLVYGGDLEQRIGEFNLVNYKNICANL